MNLYALKFREKGEKKYQSALIMAKDDDELNVSVQKLYKDEGLDIDKRTVTWTGSSIPFMMNNGEVEIFQGLPFEDC